MTLRLSDKNAALAQKMIRMLSSDKDNEVIISVRKLAGVLGCAGKSFHDLADQVQAGTDPAPTYGPTPPWHRPQQPWTPEETWGEDEVDEEKEEEAKPPVYAALKQYQRLAWLRLVLDKQQLEPADAAIAADAAKSIAAASGSGSTGYLLNRQQEKVFNRLVNRAWRVGLRI